MVLHVEKDMHGCVFLLFLSRNGPMQNFGFGLFEPGRLPDLTAFTDSGERT